MRKDKIIIPVDFQDSSQIFSWEEYDSDWHPFRKIILNFPVYTTSQDFLMALHPSTNKI